MPRKSNAAGPEATIPAPDDKAFGRRLQEIRKRRGMSQVELAQKLGIHQPSGGCARVPRLADPPRPTARRPPRTQLFLLCRRRRD